MRCIIFFQNSSVSSFDESIWGRPQLFWQANRWLLLTYPSHSQAHTNPEVGHAGTLILLPPVLIICTVKSKKSTNTGTWKEYTGPLPAAHDTYLWSRRERRISSGGKHRIKLSKKLPAFRVTFTKATGDRNKVGARGPRNLQGGERSSFRARNYS